MKLISRHKPTDKVRQLAFLATKLERRKKRHPASRFVRGHGVQTSDFLFKGTANKKKRHPVPVGLRPRLAGKPAIRKSSGQLSIFALLIFQTLFILFAMSLNIALVVHDKINLQNSVDIAAYYGAMKQAEMLNAIAHINYQIRQSWKLLTWRYRVLGSIGLTNVPTNSQLANPPNENDQSPHHLPAYYHANKGKFDPTKKGPYFFCVGHQWWGGLIKPADMQPIGDQDEDLLCAGMGDHIAGLQLSGAGSGSGSSLFNLFRGIDGIAKRQNFRIQDKCRVYGFNSWLLGASSFAHFYRDQSDRKYMIYDIATALKDGKDLDGNSIQAGVENTLTKNLSFINRQAVGPPMPSGTSLDYFSSLENKLVNDLLEDQPFFFTGLYSKFESPDQTPVGDCERSLSYVDSPQGNVNLSDISVRDILTIIQSGSDNHIKWPNCSMSNKICLPSAGMKKKTKLVVYYGVKAKLEYKNQIFLPFQLTLRAKAFAKPFGGRIGPTNEQDLLLSEARPPPRPPPSIASGYLEIAKVDREYSPNYSRYPGDKRGLRSQLVHWYWADHVRGQPNQNAQKNIHNYIKTDTEFLNDRDPMASGASGATARDKLLARQWEIAAVAPDLFDVTYFTILPYYQYDYFPRLADGILKTAKSTYLRGDLGTYCENPPICSANSFKGTSILTQVANTPLAHGKIESVWQKLKNPQQFHHALSSLEKLKKPAYKISSLNLLLTGWNPPKTKYSSATNYGQINNTYFGKCQDQGWVHEKLARMPASHEDMSNTKGKIANGCIFGGRTGYSVKMLQRDYVCSEARDFSPRPPDTWCQ